MKRFRYVYAASLILLGVITGTTLLLIAGLPRISDTYIDYEMPSAWNEGWHIEEDGGDRTDSLSVAVQPAKAQKNRLVLNNSLPQIQGKHYVIFENQSREVIVKLDGVPVYSYTKAMSGPIQVMMGNTLCLVPVGEADSGKTLTVIFENTDTGERGSVPQFFMGDLSQVMVKILREEMPKAIFCLVLLIIGAVLLIFGTVIKVRERVNAGGVFFASLFILLSALWIYTDSKISLLFNWDARMICLVSFYAFFLLPLPMLVFLEDVAGRRSRLLGAAKLVVCLNCLGQSCLYLAGAFNYYEMITVTHLSYGMVIICVLAFIYQEHLRHHSFYVRVFISGIGGFVLMAAIALISYYVGTGMFYPIWYEIALLIFILALVVMALHQIRERADASERSRIYQQLAYIDYMTQLGNRLAYEEEIKRLQEKVPVGGYLTAIIMDLNGLKRVNDRQGHSAGDALIRQASVCIRSTFEKYGNIYRIGGDEFAVLMPGKKSDKDYAGMLGRVVHIYNQENLSGVSIAVGIYGEKRAHNNAGWVESLIGQADKNMYVDKNMYTDKNKRSAGENE